MIGVKVGFRSHVGNRVRLLVQVQSASKIRRTARSAHKQYCPNPEGVWGVNSSAFSPTKKRPTLVLLHETCFQLGQKP